MLVPTQPENADESQSSGPSSPPVVRSADEPAPEALSPSTAMGERSDSAPPIHGSDEYRCHNCGYSLRGLAATGICPECRFAYDPLPPNIPAGYVCYRCSYSLAGMPTDGACPECGTQYSFAHAFRGLPYPGQGSLVWKIGWPVLIAMPLLLWTLFTAIGNRGPEESLMCLVALLFIANLLNFPIATSSIIRTYVPPSRRKGYFAALKHLGGWVVASWLCAGLFLVGPIAMIGFAILAIMLR